ARCVGARLPAPAPCAAGLEIARLPRRRAGRFRASAPERWLPIAGCDCPIRPKALLVARARVRAPGPIDRYAEGRLREATASRIPRSSDPMETTVPTADGPPAANVQNSCVGIAGYLAPQLRQASADCPPRSLSGPVRDETRSHSLEAIWKRRAPEFRSP